uniref:non-specific serine/threonine protein kinase n=1 Tax=Eutreptiella gymnastica TaxID=73025 RepID=A0A7S1NHD4_9EUGL
MLVKDKYGQVFVAKELNLNTMSKKDRRSAENEVKLLEQVDHPFIIKFVDSFIDPDGKMFIIMEYADGGDLGGRIKLQRRRREHFSERQIMLWFTQLCLALDHLHEKKILHRDLKTMNVFLTSNNIVKLGDFGFSKRLKTAAMAHTICGTPYYFSPELCQGQAYSNKSDIWSLGVILYELAMLARPYEAQSMQELMKKIVYGQYTPPAADCPVRISRLIFYMLSKKDTVRPSVTKILLNSYVQTFVAEIPTFLRISTHEERYPKELAPEAVENAGQPVPTDAAPLADPVEIPGADINDKEPLKASVAVMPTEMEALKAQLSTKEAPKPEPEPEPQAELAPEEGEPEEEEAFQDDYESDFEEYEDEDEADPKKASLEEKKEKFIQQLGADKFQAVCEILQMNDEDTVQGKLEGLLTLMEMDLVPQLSEYLINDTKNEMAAGP